MVAWLGLFDRGGAWLGHYIGGGVVMALDRGGVA